MIETELRELAAMPVGEYRIRRSIPWWKVWHPRQRLGWLTVERDSERTDVMWTTNRKTHDASGGPALSLTVAPSGTLICYMESVLRFHIRWGYGQGGDAELRKAHEFARWAHEKLCCGAATSES